MVIRCMVIPTVTIRRTLSEGMKTLALAHEIGHLIFHLPLLVAEAIGRERMASSGGGVPAWSRDEQRVEAEADWFAAQLLVPSLMRSYLENGFPGLGGDNRVLVPRPDGNVHQVDLRTRAWKWFYEIAKRHLNTNTILEGEILDKYVRQRGSAEPAPPAPPASTPGSSRSWTVWRTWSSAGMSSWST